jgi:two-component system nitrogen regulation sensor histidine kinase NtrY
LLDRADAAEGARGARIRLWFPEAGPPEEVAAAEETGRNGSDADKRIKQNEIHA